MLTWSGNLPSVINAEVTHRYSRFEMKRCFSYISQLNPLFSKRECFKQTTSSRTVDSRTHSIFLYRHVRQMHKHVVEFCDTGIVFHSAETTEAETISNKQDRLSRET